MNTPDERQFWFRGDQPSGYQAVEQRSGGGTPSHPDQSYQDPLTDSTPIEASVRASLAEAQEQEAARAEWARLEVERVRLEAERLRLEEERAHAEGAASGQGGTGEPTGYPPGLPHQGGPGPGWGYQDVPVHGESYQAAPPQNPPHQAVPYQEIRHQHLERVPRYTNPAGHPEAFPGQVREAGPVVLGPGADSTDPAAAPGAAAAPEGAPTGAPQTDGPEAGDAPSSGPTSGYEPDTGALPEVSAATSAPTSAQPADTAAPDAPLADSPTGHQAQVTAPPGPANPPWPLNPPGPGNPTGPPHMPGPGNAAGHVATGSAPPVPPPGQSDPARYDTEAGIPPSLAPMLTQADSPYVQHTEPLPRGGPAATGYPPGSQQPGQPMPGHQSGSSRPAPRANPTVLGAVVLATLLAAVPSVLLLYDAVLRSDRVDSSGAVGGTLMLVGLPLLAAGVAPLIGNRAHAPHSARDVLRPPWPYLLTGLILLLAAGLAVGG